MVDDGVLHLQGDAAANVLTVERAAPGETIRYRVTPSGGTTLNGSPESAVFEDVTAGLTAALGDGDDDLTLTNMRIFGSVRLDGGDGNDRLLVRSVRPTGFLTLAGGEGDDQLLVRKGTSQRNLVLDGGAGNDTYRLSHQHLRERLVLTDRLGASEVSFSRTSIDGQAAVATGDAADTLVLDLSTFKSDAALRTAGEGDEVRIYGTVFRKAGDVDAGEGANRIDREVILGWDFNNGEQGWEAALADIPAREINGTNADGTPYTTEEALAFEAGIAALPPELNLDGRAYKIAARNITDSVFHYLARPLGPEDGLQPNTQYIADFEVRQSSPDLSTLFTDLKVGAVPREPQLVPREGFEYELTLNVDKGVQSNSGTEMSVAAPLNDTGDDRPPFRYQYRHVHPVPARTDSEGRLWLIVGVESAYEVYAAFYFERIGVRLTQVSGS